MKLHIRDWRRRRGLTLKELAAMVGSSEATLSRLENDRTSVTTTWLDRLAGALDVDPRELLSSERSRPADPSSVAIVAEMDGLGSLHPFAAQLQVLEGMADPVACRVLRASGSFVQGDFLIGQRDKSGRIGDAVGRLVFGLTGEGDLNIGRLCTGDRGFWLVPEGGRGTPTSLTGFRWCAVVRWILRPADERAI